MTDRRVPFEINLGRGVFADAAFELEFRTTDGGHYGSEQTTSFTRGEMLLIMERAEAFWEAQRAYFDAGYDDEVFWENWDNASFMPL